MLASFPLVLTHIYVLIKMTEYFISWPKSSIVSLKSNVIALSHMIKKKKKKKETENKFDPIVKRSKST